jgi:hypothetical protein
LKKDSKFGRHLKVKRQKDAQKAAEKAAFSAAFCASFWRWLQQLLHSRLKLPKFCF